MSAEAEVGGTAAKRGQGQKPALPRVLIVVVTLGAVVVAALITGARFSSATMGLLAATAALLLCLHALYRITGVLLRPNVEAVIDHESVLDLVSVRELREEKRRLVRAINELTFDHEMGKLSKADYEAVRELYQLQAVEVMRGLQGSSAGLHPELEEEVRRLGFGPAASALEPEAASTSTSTSEGEAVVCAGCAVGNDPDARFCKQCGAALKGDA